MPGKKEIPNAEDQKTRSLSSPMEQSDHAQTRLPPT